MRRSVATAILLVAVIALGQPAVAQPPSTPPPVPSPRPKPPATTAVFAAAPGASVTPTGLPWARATLPVVDEPFTITDLTAWAGGFVALEQTPDDELVAVWRSTDGTAWERAAVGTRMRGMASLVVDGDTLVLGIRELYARSGPIELWRSTDGIAWTRDGRLTLRLPPGYAAPWWVAVGPLRATGGHLLQYAILTDDSGMGGWAPVGPQLASIDTQSLVGRSGPDRNFAWITRDGPRWERRPLSGAGADTASLDVLTTTEDGLLALRLGGRRTALLRSTDGLRWSQVAPLPRTYSWGGSEGLVPVDGSVLLFADDDDPGTGYGNHLGAWRLEADGSWIRVLDAQAAFTKEQAAGDGWVLVAGRSWDSVREWAWMLVSGDGGRTWDPGLGWIGAADSCAGDVAIRDGTAVMLGCDGEDPAIWVARLPEASVATPPGASPVP
jgi:hypothetical protein